MKSKLAVFLLSSIILLTFAGFVSARSNGGRQKVSLPKNAVEVAPDIFYLGVSKDIDGRQVEGYAFIRREKGYARPAKPPQGGGVICYAFLAKGAKWRAVEAWLVNPANARGLADNFVLDDLGVDIGKWEGVAGKNILGDGLKTSKELIADAVSTDGKNEVYFADVDSPGAIAITIVWGIFSGPPQVRELVEWDQVYDEVDFDWSSSGEAGKMDFENIATHELGHSVGLDDLYQDACKLGTMFGYADYGETIKRSLEAGDIAGVRELYK